MDEKKSSRKDVDKEETEEESRNKLLLSNGKTREVEAKGDLVGVEPLTTSWAQRTAKGVSAEEIVVNRAKNDDSWSSTTRSIVASAAGSATPNAREHGQTGAVTLSANSGGDGKREAAAAATVSSGIATPTTTTTTTSSTNIVAVDIEGGELADFDSLQ
uniref:Uncharacterized protein n=1 Tax=Melanopsichium pennsylvanicum 4 TaxID=1398559 RepID=A0A077QW28_9BASI|nr:uncharacterized protein BN887_00926 [Melanopsichium pennsylvanicum 4]